MRLWAHRTRKHVLVVDITLVSGPGGAVNFTTLWDPLVQSTAVTGNGCAGSFSVDFDWTGPTALPLLSRLRTGSTAAVAAAPQQWAGVTRLASDAGQRPNVSVVLDVVLAAGGSITLSPTAPTATLLVSVATSIDEEFPGGTGSAADVAALAAQEYAAAAAESPTALWSDHAAAWAALNAAGIIVEPASADPSDVARAADIASHARSSRYFLFSSLRDDHFPGISPGGLSTENYQGAVFMDADWCV
jgi:trehalose/maltose hydrolase-like predicted phosphorylase